MKLADENKLIVLLRELINQQDNVTHCNEKGKEFEENTKIFIIEREKIYNEILNFVRLLVNTASESSVYQELEMKYDALEDKLQKIKNWCNAYPLDVFPEPDMKVVRALLQTGGVILDEVSASNMRHVLKGIVRIVEE